MPFLPTDRRRRLWKTLPCAVPADQPLVTVSKENGALCLAAVDHKAAALGLAPGMTLTDARAIHPRLVAAEADPPADRHFLENVGDWCLRYTPLIALAGTDGLLLDISGCAHLFGGEKALRDDLVRRLTRQGLIAKAAIAPTIGAAWAAVHFGTGDIAEGDERTALIDLPLRALRLPVTTAASLERLGLKRIGDILDRPRAPLTARFGPLVLHRLAQALGTEEEPLSPRLPLAPYMAERRLAEPIAHETAVMAIILSLARRLSEMLERHGEGARHIRLMLFRADGAVKFVEAALSRPTREPQTFCDLLRERLMALADQFDPGFGFDCITLAILEAIPFAAETIFSDTQEEADLARLVDRLGAHFGSARVTRLTQSDSHIPEYASVSRGARSAGDPDKAWNIHTNNLDEPPLRPIRLFERPEPVQAIAAVPDGPPVRFRWRSVLHEVTRVEGPERIASEWWRDEGGYAFTRDYFRVEDAAGRRFWLFRDGLYDRETTEPRWFVHGLFA
jgi:protein ImuB